MHVASGDRFVSFKAGGDRRDDSFFFYHVGYRTGWTDGRTKTNVASKDVHALFFVVVGDIAFELKVKCGTFRTYISLSCLYPEELRFSLTPQN